MIRLRKPVSFGVGKLSDLVSGKAGAVFTHSTDSGFFSTSKEGLTVYRDDYKNITVTGDCIAITSGGDETYVSGKDGIWIGNYYRLDAWLDPGKPADIILEEFPETDYPGSTYVLVAEGTIEGGGILSATGKPRTFSCMGTSYQYVTYKGNLLSAANDDVTVNARHAASFTGRYAERWLNALAGNSFLCSPVLDGCVEPFDISVNDGYSTVTSLVPVKNVYLSNCLSGRALPNVNYEVIGEFYGDLSLYLYEPETCQLPYRFLIDNKHADNRRCRVCKYDTGNGGEEAPVMWVTGNVMAKGCKYLLTVQGMVARLEKVAG